MRITAKLLLFLLIVLDLGAGYAKAENKLPDMLVGRTIIETEGQIIYAGMTGNHAVLNLDEETDYGFNYSRSGVLNPFCLNGTLENILGAPKCFFLGKGLYGMGNPGTGRLMTARTLISDTPSGTGSDPIPVYELPALFVGGVNVFGDAYLGSDLNYLRFWGNSLSEGRGTVAGDGSAWKVQNYQFNPEAQVVYSSEDAVNFRNKIQVLANNGPVISAPDFLGKSNLWLQAKTPLLFTDTVQQDAAAFPDGKVWVVNGNLTLNSDLLYHGQGTIIVNGNLTVTNGTDLGVTADDRVSHLGIIVAQDQAGAGGSCSIQGNNKIRASMICLSGFIGGSNLQMTGSFVASNFSLGSSVNVLFTYDPTFSELQPPGFRYLDIPNQVEVGNN